MESFEEQRRKARMSPDEFAAIQQPVDQKTGRKNPLFYKLYNEQNKKKQVTMDRHTEEQEAEAKENEERNNFDSKEKRLHPKYSTKW